MRVFISLIHVFIFIIIIFSYSHFINQLGKLSYPYTPVAFALSGSGLDEDLWINKPEDSCKVCKTQCIETSWDGNGPSGSNASEGSLEERRGKLFTICHPYCGLGATVGDAYAAFTKCIDSFLIDKGETPPPDQQKEDCNVCKKSCDLKQNEGEKKSCYENCSKNISGCINNYQSDTLALNKFAPFEPIEGGFGYIQDLNVSGYIKDVLSIGSAIFGGLALLKIIFGGVMYATAAGNAQRIADAKSHILYALLGLALVLGANIMLGLFGAGTLY